MSADSEAPAKTAIDDAMLTELREQAAVLSALDQAEDIALDLHERPFSPETRERVLQWLGSDTYETARRCVRPIQGLQSTSSSGTD